MFCCLVLRRFMLCRFVLCCFVLRRFVLCRFMLYRFILCCCMLRRFVLSRLVLCCCMLRRFVLPTDAGRREFCVELLECSVGCCRTADFPVPRYISRCLE